VGEIGALFASKRRAYPPPWLHAAPGRLVSEMGIRLHLPPVVAGGFFVAMPESMGIPPCQDARLAVEDASPYPGIFRALPVLSPLPGRSVGDVALVTEGPFRNEFVHLVAGIGAITQ
jgi:hypothetical protein